MATDESRPFNSGVDVENWSFYGRGESRPTPFLVGPIVGSVTETTARVLVEMQSTMEVTMTCFMDEEQVLVESKEVEARTPTAFELTGFTGGKRVLVTVDVGDFGDGREAQFITPSEKTQWKIAAVSCNCHTKTERLGLWDRLGRVAGELDCVLHLGDQIYADEDLAARNDPTMRFDSAWRACMGILDPLSPDEWDSRREELLEQYRRTYRTTWNMPAVAKVLASAANYMICDDHEVVDDLGDEPEHCEPDTRAFYVIKVAYQVYLEYQRQLLTDTEVLDSSTRPYYAWMLSPKIGVFMMDNRVERSLHRGEGAPEAWENRDFLGPRQWARLTQALEEDFAECDTVLLGAPTPLVFISQAATGMAEKVIDDARGTWGHERFKTEQQAMCSLLSEWQNARPNRALVTLAGDVHVGGFTDSWHNNHKAALHQLTASAVGNTPEGNMDMMKKAVMRQAMHADSMFFEFKVKHHEWVFGPNYGMIDIALEGEQRPNITLTLVQTQGKAKVRNLQLDCSKVPVHSPDHSAASRSAHAAVKIMDEPLAHSGNVSGGCCNCSIS